VSTGQQKKGKVGFVFFWCYFLLLSISAATTATMTMMTAAMPAYTATDIPLDGGVTAALGVVETAVVGGAVVGGAEV